MDSDPRGFRPPWIPTPLWISKNIHRIPLIYKSGDQDEGLETKGEEGLDASVRRSNVRVLDHTSGVGG